MPVGVAIEGLFAVGMHHYGPRELRVGCGYKLQSEPSNPYDCNAIAIQEHGITRAYLCRQSASKFIGIMNSGLITGSVYLKPKFPAEVRSRRIGPQQFCNVGFRVKDNDLEQMKSLLRQNSLSFRCLGRI